MYKIITTEKFNSALSEIKNQFVNDYQSKSGALDFVDRVYKAFDNVSIFPKMYPQYDSSHITSDIKYRYIVIKKYLLFYSVDEKNKSIIFDDIVYSKRKL